MKKHLYLMPIMALSLSTFALTACDDKKDDAAVTAETTTETTAPIAMEAAPQVKPTVDVSNAYSFATAEGATTGAVFVTLHNPQTQADMLTAASAADVAGSAEIHENFQDPQTGTAEMRKTAGVDLAAGADLKLEPPAFHIMLLDLKKPLVQGETFNVTLTFRNAGDITVPVTINAAGSSSTEAAPMDHGAMAPADTTTAPAESMSGDEEAAPATTTTTTTTTTTPAAPDAAAPATTEPAPADASAPAAPADDKAAE